MEPKPLSSLACFIEPFLASSDPQVVDVSPADVANLVAIRLQYMNPAVRGAT